MQIRQPRHHAGKLYKLFHHQFGTPDDMYPLQEKKPPYQRR